MKVILVTPIDELGMVDATSTLLIREGANPIVGAVAMATLFALQQRRMISGQQPNLLLALSNATRYLGASIGAATMMSAACLIRLCSPPVSPPRAI
jgi:hypothetical protein